MDTVTILRELWHRRILVGLAALMAILVGLLLTYTVSLPPESRQYEVGIASSRILVDTPDSQVVDVAPKGSETLGARANLLANLMTEGEVKTAIARRAGLRPKQLLAGAESGGELPAVLSTTKRGDQVHLLTTRLVINPGGEALPIIEIEAQAPNAEGAARLAGAAVAGLGDYLDSKAATEEVPEARRLEVTGLGAPQAREEPRGPRRMIAIGAAVFVFLGGCAAILLVSRLARGWRAAAQPDEHLETGDEHAEPDDHPTLFVPFDRQRSDDPERNGGVTRDREPTLDLPPRRDEVASRPAKRGVPSSAEDASAASGESQGSMIGNLLRARSAGGGPRKVEPGARERASATDAP